MRIPRLTMTLAGIAVLVAVALVVGGTALGATKPTKADMLAGKKIFTAKCGSCHTLKAAKTHGTVGPKLDGIHPSLAAIVTQVTNGGRFMPPFGKAQGGTLSSTQIKQVAAFVYGAEHHLIS